MEKKRTRYYTIALHRLLVLLLAAALVPFESCVRRELEEGPVPPSPPSGEGYAEITLDWGGYAASPVPPHTSRCLLYDAAGALVREVTGVGGRFRESLPAGRYRLVVHNEDARQVGFCGTERYETAEVMAQEITSSRHSDDGTPCILEPEQVYATGVCREAAELVVTAGETVRATAVPATLTREVRFSFIIRSENGVQSLTGLLNGVSRGIYLATGRRDVSSSCSVAFTAEPAKDGREGDDGSGTESYTTEIGVFDLLAAEEGSPEGTSTLDVTLTDTRGEPYTGRFDITATLKEIIAGNGGVIPVEIPIEVDIKLEPIGGMTADVKPWDGSGTGEGEFN